MEEELYDEFGNYIGPDLDESESDEEALIMQPMPHSPEVLPVALVNNQITLHEDKKYYPSAEEVYGAGVETLVHEEDTQMITQPIIAPPKQSIRFECEKDTPETSYDKQFLIDLMDDMNGVRNLAVVGHLGHGKSSFMDMIVRQTHGIQDKEDLRYTDVHMLERQRGVSIKSMPMTVVMQDLKGKSFVLNLMDTPGHVDFVDEVVVSLRICDGALLIVDAVEGVMVNTERIIKRLAHDKIPFVLVINKIDRLMLELKLPPQDTYFKLKHTIEEVNNIVSKVGGSRVSPEIGNVAFCSSKLGFCFTLKSFAKLYADRSEEGFEIDQFARRLWGDLYFDSECRRFKRSGSQRSFIEFILNPLYKLIGHVLGEKKEDLKILLKELGITLKNRDYLMNMKPLLSLTTQLFFGSLNGLTDVCISKLPSPITNAPIKVESYKGDTTSRYYKAIQTCDIDGPLMVQVVKMYNTDDVTSFETFGRVLSGTLRQGMRVRVLGEGYSAEDEEEMSLETIECLYIFESRYKIKVKEVRAGGWVLIAGVDSTIMKTATITGVDEPDPEDVVCAFKKVRFDGVPVMKIAVEPINPMELPRMLDGLRKINKSYPILKTKVEESGEHVILGTGELYMDCVLHDLRKLYSEIDIKVADPVVTFCETVVEVSSIKCYAETANKKNKITMICEPMEKGIAEDIESQRVDINQTPKALGGYFMETYGWDVLAAVLAV